MPTSDERREVAARLRKCGAELSILGADCETAFHVIDKVIGCREEDSWERFLARLADLIDPTCHNADDGVRGGFVCSECSYHVEQDTMDADFNAWEDLRHCPKCGARVTDGRS